MMVDFYGLFSVDVKYILFGMLGITIIAIVLSIVAICKMNATKKKFHLFMGGKDGRTLEPLLMEKFKEIEELQKTSAKNVKNIRFLLDKIHYSYQKTGIVKYDAFHEMGGKLSFALAMLDNKNNGYIINSMHSREGCYTYIKEVVSGEAYIELGKEEAEALKMALAGPMGDVELGALNDVINNTYVLDDEELKAESEVAKAAKEAAATKKK